MGGKGQRRREKNYLAVHGGGNRLPPPPKLKELEAIPSKLRRLMELQSNPPPCKIDVSLKHEKNAHDDSTKRKGGKDQKGRLSISDIEFKSENNIEETMSCRDEDTKLDNKKRKKNRKKINDLRFQILDTVDHSMKRKRKKEYLEARKKKNKQQKVGDVGEFPGHEDIKFGEVVEAPPKLSFPKVSKPHDASHERLRLKAVEAYRNRKKWVSRPGLQLPAIVEPSSL